MATARGWTRRAFADVLCSRPRLARLSGHDEGDLDEAATAFRDLLDRYPNFTIARFQPGRAARLEVVEGVLWLDQLDFVELLMTLEEARGVDVPDDLLETMEAWTLGQILRWFEKTSTPR